MDNLLLIILFFLVGAGLVSMLTRRSSEKDEKKLRDYPYVINENFLSAAELNFFRTLQQVVGNQAVVVVKVNLGDVFWAKPKDKKTFRTYRNMIDRKHVDFLLCDPVMMRPIMGIELDDKSHQRADRRERDQFVDKVFEAARLPLLHMPVKRGYVMAELAAQIAPYLDGRPAIPPQMAPVPQKANAAKTCPKCGSEMTLRKAKKGPNAGQQFWGCVQYPNCKTVLPYTG